MVTPLDHAFWLEEYERLRGKVPQVMLSVFMAGAQSGTEMLPEGLRVLVDWDWFNQSAVDWLNTWGTSTLVDISATTERNITKIIGNWIQSGRNIEVLKKQLAPWVGKERAGRIATTEVTRAYAEGNVKAWRATGYIGMKRWMTAVDERVCPICAPLHGMAVGLDENGFTTESFGMGLYAPPAHPGCRCWLQPVVSEEMLLKRGAEILG